MGIGIFKPQLNEKHKYAVALGTDVGTLAILKTYPSYEQLETGYKEWHDMATQKNLTKPVPIELLDDTGKCKILEELLISPEKN